MPGNQVQGRIGATPPRDIPGPSPSANPAGTARKALLDHASIPAGDPRSPSSKASGAPSIKRFLVGKRIPSSLALHERLSRVTGLAVLSSDALSSVAYATDFILI